MHGEEKSQKYTINAYNRHVVKSKKLRDDVKYINPV